MDQKIINLAAIKSFYDNGDDFFNVFGKIVVQHLSVEKKFSLRQIQTVANKNLEFDIPEDVLKTIIKRLRKNELVSYESLKTESIYLTEKGKEEQIKVMSSIKETERESGALINSIQKFVKARINKDIQEKEIEIELSNFIKENSYSATLILEGEIGEEITRPNSLQLLIADFFVASERSDPDSFERLKAILYGEVISMTLLKGRFDKEAKFQNLVIYLDTNIVFSLMELHEADFNKPVIEIIKIINKLGIKLKIFSFTKDEITNKLRSFIEKSANYSDHIKVDSIYYVLKSQGYSAGDIIPLIENIKQKIEGMGVEIDYTFKIDELIKGKKDEQKKMYVYKSKSNKNSRNHDLAAICAINKLRGSRKSHILENSKYVFLTADSGLYIYNFKKHAKYKTFPEVIYRSELANILWLKKVRGSDNALVHNFLANHSRNKMISSSLWEKFIDEVRKQERKGNITQDDIETAIAYEEIENILKTRDTAGIKAIINDKRIKKRKIEIHEKDTKLEESLKIIEEQSEQLEEISRRIETKCKKRWSRIINFLVFIIGSWIVYSMIRFLIQKGISVFADYCSIMMIPIVIILCISIIFKKEFIVLNFLIELRSNFENKIMSKCIDRKMKDINFSGKTKPVSKNK